VILFGSDYWSGLVDWLRQRVLGANNITQEDVDSIHVVDTPEEVRDIVMAYHEQAERHAAKQASPSQIIRTEGG
jgi:predicted Rossmann-fold nucleotide-binding protein